MSSTGTSVRDGNSPISKMSAKYWTKMQKPTIAPMTILAQRRPKFKGSFSSMSSASGTSPVSSESNPEGFGNYNTILSSGRSLDQLYKFSIEEDIDISNEKIQNQ